MQAPLKELCGNILCGLQLYGVLIMVGDSNMLSWTHKRQLDLIKDRGVSEVKQSGVTNSVLLELTEREREWGRQWLSKGGLKRWNEREKKEKGRRVRANQAEVKGGPRMRGTYPSPGLSCLMTLHQNQIKAEAFSRVLQYFCM